MIVCAPSGHARAQLGDNWGHLHEVGPRAEDVGDMHRAGRVPAWSGARRRGFASCGAAVVGTHTRPAPRARSHPPALRRGAAPRRAVDVHVPVPAEGRHIVVCMNQRPIRGEAGKLKRFGRDVLQAALVDLTSKALLYVGGGLLVAFLLLIFFGGSLPAWLLALIALVAVIVVSSRGVTSVACVARSGAVTAKSRSWSRSSRALQSLRVRWGRPDAGQDALPTV